MSKIHLSHLREIFKSNSGGDIVNANESIPYMDAILYPVSYHNKPPFPILGENPRLANGFRSSSWPEIKLVTGFEPRLFQAKLTFVGI